MLWNQTVHHHVNKSPPLVPVLNHINAVHALQFYYFTKSINIISHLCLDLPSSLCCWFLHPKPYLHFCNPTYVPRAQSISYPLIWSPELYLAKNTDHEGPLRAVFSNSPCSTLFCPNIFLSTLFSNSLSPCYCLHMTDHISYSCQITGKIILPRVLFVICLGMKRKGKRFIHKATWHYQGR